MWFGRFRVLRLSKLPSGTEPSAGAEIAMGGERGWVGVEGGEGRHRINRSARHLAVSTSSSDCGGWSRVHEQDALGWLVDSCLGVTQKLSQQGWLMGQDHLLHLLLG